MVRNIRLDITCYNNLRLVVYQTQGRDMDNNRRDFIGKSIATSLVALFTPSWVFANWPQNAFEQTNLKEALTAIVKQGSPQAEGVTLTAPKIAENGGQVRVAVQATVDNVEWISILVEKNPVPLTSQFLTLGRSEPYVEANVKVRETSNVIAVVKAGDRFYSASQEVKVTAGGCG